jgi:hypothetical protein
MIEHNLDDRAGIVGALPMPLEVASEHILWIAALQLHQAPGQPPGQLTRPVVLVASGKADQGSGGTIL